MCFFFFFLWRAWKLWNQFKCNANCTIIVCIFLTLQSRSPTSTTPPQSIENYNRQNDRNDNPPTTSPLTYKDTTFGSIKPRSGIVVCVCICLNCQVSLIYTVLACDAGDTEFKFHLYQTTLESWVSLKFKQTRNSHANCFIETCTKTWVVSWFMLWWY